MNKKQKFLNPLFILVILGCLGLYFSENTYSSEPNLKISLRLLQTPTSDPDRGPMSQIFLIIKNGVETKEIPFVTGENCTGGPLTTEADKANFPGALLLAKCWWAGSGTNIGIFRGSDTSLVVKEQALEEGMKKGKFKIIKTINIPSGSQLEPL